MTNEEYLVVLIDLITKLTNACNDFGLRSDEYNAVLKDIHASAVRFNRNRWRRSMFAGAFIAFLLFLLALYVIYILID
ncbi:hypothetical protein ES705_25114 [subsurface metagenome]